MDLSDMRTFEQTLHEEWMHPFRVGDFMIVMEAFSYSCGARDNFDELECRFRVFKRVIDEPIPARGEIVINELMNNQIDPTPEQQKCLDDVIDAEFRLTDEQKER
jgi:hypothetical protein